ncbi:fungal-specific transcription factor domain-containing protein [Aspergillus heterothallicus]
MPRRETAPGRPCFECRRRRIKCDRSHPSCSYCTKVRVDCRYPVAARSVLDDDQTALSRIADLESRLLAVEQRLPDIDAFRPLPSSAALSPEQREHAEQPERRERQPPNRTESLITQLYNSQPTGNVSFTLVDPQPPIDLAPFRPPAPVIALLWQKYVEVVDPLLKTFHTPTVQMLVMKVIATPSLDPLEMASECLLFVIYYGAVTAISHEEYVLAFEEERASLLKRYRTVIENLLSRLNLLETLDLTVLQALTIYLIVGRFDGEGTDAYARVGLAVGMALRMGLNKDGEAARLPPFEVEMRRRLWWQICILDIRVAEDTGSEPCILESSFNTRLPTNTADASLHPDMSRSPVAENSRTEMLYSLVRFEGSYFARQLVFSAKFSKENGYESLTEVRKLQALDLFQQRIEEQYLSHCDDHIPFDRVTAQSIRLVLRKFRLMVHTHYGEQPLKITRSLAETSMRYLQDAERLRAYGPGKQWLWLFQTYLEWDVLATLLLYLRERINYEEMELIWEVADRVFVYWKGIPWVSRDQRWKRIEKLRQEVPRGAP